LRQLGTALNAYIQAHQVLPPAARWTAEGFDVATMDAEPSTGHVTHENWLQLILPGLGEGALADRFDRSVPVTDRRNEAARTTSLEILSCPADSFNRRDNPYRYEDRSRSIRAEFARGNYAINGGSQAAGRYPGRPSAPVADGYHYEFDRESGEFAWWGNGIAGINRAFGPGEFRNGTSTLVALEEIRAGLLPVDSRGAWALGHIGGSITFAHGASGDDSGPNSRGDRADDVVGCNKLHEALGEEALLRDNMPCCSYWMTNAQATARSQHPGGINALMLDGSVRFLADAIDPTLWHVLHSRETPGDKVRADDLAAAEEVSVPAGSPDAIPISTAREEAKRRPMTSVINSIGMELAYIPPSEFVMGIPDAGFEDKVPPTAPAHRVKLSRPYYIGVFEVTQEQFRRLMGGDPSWHTAHLGFEGLISQDTGMMPVERVSWEDAAEFCRRLSSLPEERRAGRSYRLPTEAEWEYACRGGDARPHEPPSSGMDPSTGENVGEHNKEVLDVVAVGSYLSNGFGLHDMRGNVFEWCSDWFARDYYQRGPIEDPPGPESGFLRVVRGSDWSFAGEGCMINRRVSPPWASGTFLGFRVAASGIAPTGETVARTRPTSWGGRDQLAVYSSHRNPRTMELIRFDVDRRTATLIRREWWASPCWSPDGRRLAFADSKSRLVVTDAKGDDARVLIREEFRFLKSPAWSPDGRRLAFAASRDGKSWAIYLANDDGGEARLVSDEASDLAMPAWSPDGSLILFVALRKGEVGVTDLVVVGPGGGPTRRLREGVPFIASPAWSPDGGKIAFTDRDEGSDRLRLVVADPVGGAHLPIAESGVNVFPGWSPDGKKIVYVHYEAMASPRGDLMLFDLTTGRSSCLSRGSLPFGEDARPSWLPLDSGTLGGRPGVAVVP